jgi:selenocysteine lyase/cysteine desulfurase
MHSDLAHECTIRSVECAADFVGALTRRTIKVRKLRISDLFDLGPEAFAKELVGRISSVCDGRGTVVLVLEHVTSLDGWLLPAAEIARRIHRITPHVELILDGAQAVGLWQPPKGLNYAYVGCFHKYVDGPVGTGFCVLPPGRADVALHRIRATQSWRFTGTGEHLPTTDVAKWKRCADALLSLSARGSARAREARIRKLRQELINQLPSEITSQVPSHQAVYRSHIFSLAFPSVDEAVRIHDRLQASAFGTKRLENLIRVTLHDTNDSSSLSSFAAFVSDAMKNEQFRHDRSTSVGDGRGF